MNDFSNISTSKSPGVISKSRYITPPKCKLIPERLLKYKYAQDLANDLIPEKDMRVFVVLDGSFIFGDFIEAWIIENDLKVKRLTISTLSYSKNNVDSLAALLDEGYVDELNLIISDDFFSKERYGGTKLVPYLYERCDKDEKFQLAAAGTHCKIVLIETHCGLKIVMDGSANLRTSSNIEQMRMEESELLYDFNLEIQMKIVEKYKTIKKSIRHSPLWGLVKG